MSRMEKENPQRVEDCGTEDLGAKICQIERTRNVIRLYHAYVADGVLKKDKSNSDMLH